jgi:hypothetical protein
MNVITKLISVAVASYCSLTVASTAPESAAIPLERQQIQEELNSKWATPLLTAFYAETCNQPQISQKIISDLKSSTPGEVLSSSITYGFMLGYSNHLLSFEQSQADQLTACAKLKTDPALLGENFDEQGLLRPPLSANDAVTNINTQLGLDEKIGSETSKSLTISLFNINSIHAGALNKRLLLEACELNSNSVTMPSLLEIVNSAGYTTKPSEKDITQLTGAWLGYSQGMYWHALSLIQNLNDTVTKNAPSERSKFCHKIANLNEGEGN